MNAARKKGSARERNAEGGRVSAANEASGGSDAAQEADRTHTLAELDNGPLCAVDNSLYVRAAPRERAGGPFYSSAIRNGCHRGN